MDEAEADAEALEAVENLLESYFVQIDGTFDKLEAIGVLSGPVTEHCSVGSAGVDDLMLAILHT